MFRRRSVFVTAIDPDTGTPGSFDVLDLDEESWRAYLLGIAVRRGLVVPVQDSLAGDPVVLRAKPLSKPEA